MAEKNLRDAGVMSGVEDMYGCTKSELEAGIIGRENITNITKSDADEVPGQIGD